MVKIDSPNFGVRKVYLTCLSNMSDESLRMKLMNCLDSLDLAEEELEKSIQNCSSHMILREKKVNGLDKSIFEKIYTYRLVNLNAPGRVYYDKIKLLAPLNICPFCLVRPVSTLDHFLPKSKYPRLTVTPINLIPCCSDCNKKKDKIFPVNKSNQFIHPYYDDLSSIQWLEAELIEGSPPYIKYNISKHLEIDEELVSRIKFQFNSLELNYLYSIQAANEISNILHLISKKLLNDTPASVENYLKENYKSRKAYSLNSWQTALYKCLYQNKWFCNGGFNYI